MNKKSSAKTVHAEKCVGSLEVVSQRLREKRTISNNEKRLFARKLYEALSATSEIKNPRLELRLGRSAHAMFRMTPLYRARPAEFFVLLNNKRLAYARCKAICDKMPAGKRKEICYTICLLYLLYCGGKG
jgi:hypothetical protein